MATSTDPNAKPSEMPRGTLVAIAVFLGLFSGVSIFAGLTSDERIVTMLCLGPGILLAIFTLCIVASILQDIRFPAEGSSEVQSQGATANPPSIDASPLN